MAGVGVGGSSNAVAGGLNAENAVENNFEGFKTIQQISNNIDQKLGDWGSSSDTTILGINPKAAIAAIGHGALKIGTPENPIDLLPVGKAIKIIKVGVKTIKAAEAAKKAVKAAKVVEEVNKLNKIKNASKPVVRETAGTVIKTNNEKKAIQRIGKNSKPQLGLTQDYKQVRGQIDYKHVEGEIKRVKGEMKVQGAHFPQSPRVTILENTMKKGKNGVFEAKVLVTDKKGNKFLKTNNDGYSTLTPNNWTLAQSKANMARAFKNKVQDKKGKWYGVSNGVKFMFHSPPNNSKITKWRGYPVKE